MSLFITTLLLFWSLKANAQTDRPLSNISLTEYETKMKMFIDAVKGTIQETTMTTLLPEAIDAAKISFQSKDIPRGREYSLRMFISGGTEAKIYQNINGSEVEIANESLATGGRWVGVFVDQHPHEELIFRIDCGPDCKITEPKLYTFININSAARTIIPRSDTCPLTVTPEVTCCLTHKDVNLKKLRRGMHIEGPGWFRFTYCIGKCVKGFNYASQHARLNHFIELAKIKIPHSYTPCLPTEYGHIQVLRDGGDKLIVEDWNEFYAKSCACL